MGDPDRESLESQSLRLRLVGNVHIRGAVLLVLVAIVVLVVIIAIGIRVLGRRGLRAIPAPELLHLDFVQHVFSIFWWEMLPAQRALLDPEAVGRHNALPTGSGLPGSFRLVDNDGLRFSCLGAYHGGIESSFVFCVSCIVLCDGLS